MAKSTKKDFLKKVSILGGAGILGLSRFGRTSAKAAVLDNSKSHEITNDRIFMNAGTYSEETPLQSGATAQKVAEAVNNLHVNFSNALAALKNTAIAQAVGAKGENFPDVIEELGAIEDFGQVTFTAKDVSDIEIKPGFYAEGSKVEISNTEILTDPNLRDEVLTVISSGEYSTAFDSNEDGNMDKVYKAVKVQVSKDEGTGKEVYDEGVRDTKKGNAIAEHVLAGKTFTSEQAGVEKTGAMPNNGSWSKSTGSNEKIMIPKGFHDGNGSVTVAVTKDTAAGKPIYEAGVKAADARANASSANYKAGYSAGQTALQNAGYVKPSGTTDITANGTYNVKNNESVKVNVSANVSYKSVSPTEATVYASTGQSASSPNMTEQPDGYTQADSMNSGLCYVKTGTVSVSNTQDSITITIPQIIRACSRFGGGGTHYDFSRNIVVTLAKE